jgi:diadenosine tetraphosphate (Ap4A) HIT family hydrolase
MNPFWKICCLQGCQDSSILKPIMMRLFAKLARTKFCRTFLIWMLQYFSFALPVHRLRETPCWIACWHPQPVYPFHILLIPKQAYADLYSVPADDQTLIPDLLAVVRVLVDDYKLAHSGYRLITNGGVYQVVPILHFHLVSDQPDGIHLKV